VVALWDAGVHGVLSGQRGGGCRLGTRFRVCRKAVRSARQAG
jgi:hypothetical protein